MGTVVVVGGVNQDLTVSAATRPRGGETVVGEGPVASPGGKGANQAVAAAYVAEDVRLCAVVGDDAAGTEQLAQLRASGVDVSHVRVSEGTATGTAFILLTPDGENSIVVGTGANAHLRPEDVAAAVGPHVSVVLVQTEPGATTSEAAAAHAARHAARLVVNAAPVDGLPASSLPLCDPLVVNEHEAMDLLRVHGGELEVPRDDLARVLAERVGCRSVVVSLGADGALVVEAGGVERIPAPRVEAVDTTGAGDVLVGVIAGRLSQGWDLARATRDACELAARAVTTRGARGYVTGTS